MSIPTKMEMVALHLLEQGPFGVSALTGLAELKDLNLRNGVSELRAAGVEICDRYFEHKHSGGGITRMKLYWLLDRDQARKVSELVNLKRKKRGALPISPEQEASYLAPYENAPTEAEA